MAKVKCKICKRFEGQKVPLTFGKAKVEGHRFCTRCASSWIIQEHRKLIKAQMERINDLETVIRILRKEETNVN